MFKTIWKKIGYRNGDTQTLAKLLVGLFLFAIVFGVLLHTQRANAAGECDMEADKKKAEVVFAVCVFADGTLIDHKGANSMSDCLKTKREVEKLWRNKAADVDSVEINGITYKIDGESLAFMCDLVDANVHHYEDGTWEIVKILGKHKK